MFKTHDVEHFTEQTIFCPNSLCSILNGLKTGSTGVLPELCLPPDRDRPRQEQVYDTSVFLARESRRTAAWLKGAVTPCGVIALLRTPKGGLFCAQEIL